MRALRYCLLAVLAAGAFLGGYSLGYRHGVDDTLPPPKFESPAEAPGRAKDWSGYASRTYRVWKSCRSVAEQDALDWTEQVATLAVASVLK